MTKLRLGQRKSDGGLLQILVAKDNQMKVRDLNSNKPEWVPAKSIEVLTKAEPGVHLRMAKEVEFDQECGCNAVVEIRNGRIETFNVYGDVEKYVKSKIRSGSEDTPHHRRMFLKEHGFVRSRGMTHEASKEKQFRKIRKYELAGYEVVEA